MVSVQGLMASAKAACSRAYAPYSGFRVGAALLTAEGIVITGSNMENASYGLTVCAERTAFWSAVHAGKTNFTRLAVAADCFPPPTPCGACRQVMWEYGGNIEVIMGNFQGDEVRRSLKELLPDPFEGPLVDRPKDIGLSHDELWRLPAAFRPIGYVSNNFTEPSAIPGNYRELLSKVVIDTDMAEGLFRLEEEKKVIVIGYLHQAGGYTLKESRSGRGGEVYGVFACRTPLRPNAISHTEVDLVERQENILTVKGLDIINGTPVIDIKTVLSSR